MILDLDHFVEREQGFWKELEENLRRLEQQADRPLTLAESQRFYYLFQRTSSDLAKIQTFSAEPEMRAYLESLVARSYSHVHEERSRRASTARRWFTFTFPDTFRRHYKAFWLAVFATFAGSAFAIAAMQIDPGTKEIFMPFAHLQGDPSDRVRAEEEAMGGEEDRLAGHKAQFSAYLMNNNIKVSILAMALGIFYGVLTIVLLFYNGVILGAVFEDYIAAGETEFLLGWLLPHGVIELPAIFIGAQAGLVLAGAMFGWGTNARLRHRLRLVRPDVVTLILGAGCLLIWAGMVESFLSQYHEPVIPYSLKIAFGTAELVLFVLYLAFVGRKKGATEAGGGGGGRDWFRMKESFGKTAALEIRTPEGVVFSQPLASPVTRFLAYSLDFLVILGLQIALSQLLSVMALVAPDVASAISIAIFFVITIGYGMFFEWLWSGRTIGKRVVGLRVIDEGGLPLKGTQVIVRNLMRFIDALPAFYFVGGVACLLSRRCQRLGDLAAGTLVVRTPRSREPRIQEVLGNKFFNAFAEYPHLEARLRQKVNPEEGQLVMHALVRREDLDPAERVSLYARLADYFRELVEFPPEAVIGLTDEQYLRNVADTVFRGRVASGRVTG